jgi:hypothetical protein
MRRCEGSKYGEKTKKEEGFLGSDDGAGDGAGAGGIPEAVTRSAGEDDEGGKAQAYVGETAGGRIKECGAKRVRQDELTRVSSGEGAEALAKAN